MRSQTRKQGFIWGALLVVLGIMLLLETLTELSAWVWVFLLLAGGLILLGFWLFDNRKRPWAGPWAPLIPTYVLWAVAALVALTELNVLRDPFVAPFVLTVIALPFLLTFVKDRSQWWALIPTYILLAVGLMVLLTESGLMGDELVPAYVLFSIAIPFFVVFARNNEKRWALIPAGILIVIGLSFLVAEAAIEYIGAAALVIAGIWIVARQFTGARASAEAACEVEPVTEATAVESPGRAEPAAGASPGAPADEEPPPQTTIEVKADEPPVE